MKKLILTLLALLALSLPAYALEATVPQFDVYVDGTKIEHKNTEYPLLTYKDVTYFPMTYDYVRMLGLTSSWLGGEFYLSYCPTTASWPTSPVEWQPDVATIHGDLVTYPVYVNGRLINNAEEEYPVFNARGITYFPLTWDFATEEFNMHIAWDGRLIINSGGGSSSGGEFSSINDGKAYFGTTFMSNVINENLTLTYNSIIGGNYVFDAASNTVSEYPYELPYENQFTYMNESFSIDGSYLMYNGTAAADITDYAAAEKERDNPLGISISAMRYDIYDTKPLVNVDMSYRTEYTPPRPLAPNSLWFILDGDALTPLDIGASAYFRSSETINGATYVCLADRSDSAPILYTTYLVTDDNKLEPIIDADHTNIELLGQIDNKPVVKATWQSEYESVSAINDGYFTVEPDGSLNKIYPYVYSNDAAVINNRLYLLVWRNNTIIDTSTGQIIQIPVEF